MNKPTLISRKSMHRGRVVDVCTERIRYEDGREYDLDLIHHPGAAAVVALDAQQRTCVVRQYRHGVEDFLWEIPAGKLDPGELPEVCARRELKEETGILAQKWSSLGVYIPAAGLMTELVHLFVAEDLQIGHARPDSDEELELQWLTLEEAIGMVLRGEWNDGKTALGLFRARYRLLA
jgi:8-oxo-dGTP pyrophosphatase MutT (NUDIX family)